MPKELLPLGAHPAVAHVVHEAIRSCCNNIMMIAGARKYAIIDYFEKAELPASFMYIPQPEPRGLGHAVLMAQTVVTDDYFAVMLPDELFFSQTPCLQQLITVAEREHACVVAVMRVPRETIGAYGVIGIHRELDDRVFEVNLLVEKPLAAQAPSCYALVGRYVLPREIFKSLALVGPGAKGEIQLTDAIAHLVRSGVRVLACVVDGVRYDIGNPLGWMQAIVRFGIDHPQYGDQLRQFIGEQILPVLDSKQHTNALNL
jgi:UTP--glucose-1-phosphate uridylyltransferase